MLKSKLVNNFEHCTNGIREKGKGIRMPKLMLLLDGSPIIIGLYILYIMSSK